MSSPIARQTKGALRQAVINLHRRLSHGRRIDILSRKITEIIDSRHQGCECITCLDVGCGDMTLAEAIGAQCPRTSWSCIDVHELPDSLKHIERWAKYRTFDGAHLPYGDSSMDVVLLCDVLHHAGPDDRELLLREAGRVGGLVIVKDHLEYSWFSRLVLKTLDFAGNWGYGIPVPDRYFTLQSLKSLQEASGLVVVGMTVGIDLYDHLPLVRTLVRPEWHFIAVMEYSMLSGGRG